jgi:predicted nucleotidyltransferase
MEYIHRMKKVLIAYPKKEIERFCQNNHIQRLAIFGSALRDDFKPDSDVDVLVDFLPGHVPGLALIRMQDELSRLLGNREVDLITPKFLNHRIRDQIISEAVTQYEKK